MHNAHTVVVLEKMFSETVANLLTVSYDSANVELWYMMSMQNRELDQES